MAAGIVFATAVMSYAIYAALADNSNRPNVNLSHILHVNKSPFWTPARIVSNVWQGVIGGFGQSMSNVLNINSRFHLIALLYGIVVATLLVLGSRGSGMNAISANSASRIGIRGVIALLVAIVAGLLPIVAMGRFPWDSPDSIASRYGLPVLPFVAILTVRGCLWITKSELWFVPIAAFGCTAGTMTMLDVYAAITERRTFAQLGTELETVVSASRDITAAVISMPNRTLGPRRQWEMVARITMDWPRDVRERFWAFRYSDSSDLTYIEEAQEILGTRVAPRIPERLDVGMREVSRHGRLGQVLWINVKRNGRFEIEPYAQPLDLANVREKIIAGRH
jgi:hypothetical protein